MAPVPTEHNDPQVVRRHGRPEGPVREADQWRGLWGNREVPPANPGALAPEAEPGRVR
jgi:hypothetical protein